jgi:hypothetical protein
MARIGYEGAMAMELTTSLPVDTAQTGADEKTAGAVRDRQWIDAVLTVIVTSMMVVAVSVLSVAINLN